MKIITIVGSASGNSLNLKLAKAVERLADGVEFDHLDVAQLPYYSYDIENDPPKSVLDMRRRVKYADGVIILSPEYNHSFSGILKNALDWMSRVELVLSGKPTMIGGATPGKFGTARANAHLKQVLRSGAMNADLYSKELLISEADKLFADDGKLMDDQTEKFLKEAIEGFKKFI